MRANLFWFNDEQWAKIEPLLPTRQPGPKPKENRRVLSGIMYVLKVGCRWQLSARIWPAQDGLQSLQPLERARNLAGNIRDGRRLARAAR
jgi:transposase